MPILLALTAVASSIGLLQVFIGILALVVVWFTFRGPKGQCPPLGPTP
jgi:hypothetical protein